MRVLLVPEAYRGQASACGTLRDAALWVDRWLEIDPHLHVYWLLPPRSELGYARSDVHADRDQVTLLEAPSLARSLDGDERLLSDCGFSGPQLDVLGAGIFDPGGYVDVVVDQLRDGQFTLRQWLLALDDNPWAADAFPFDLVSNVHDLQLPRKHRGCGHRGRRQGQLDVVQAAFADGIWFTAGVDRDGWRRQADRLLDDALVREAWQGSITIGSPLELEAFDHRYASEPTTLHLAGSFWEKKRADRLLAIARRLHEERGIRVLVTSMDPVPEAIAERSWLEAHGRASARTYRRALRRGDLAICASAYETMARTPFEQAASGQVLVARAKPWIRECAPDGHPLLAPLDELGDLALAALDDWEESIAVNRRLVAHLRRTRSPARVGDRTHRDLRERVDAKCRGTEGSDLVGTVERIVSSLDPPIELPRLLDACPGGDGTGATLAEREDVTRTDVVHALRAAGYVDLGRSPTPRFAPPEASHTAAMDVGDGRARRTSSPGPRS